VSKHFSSCHCFWISISLYLPQENLNQILVFEFAVLIHGFCLLLFSNYSSVFIASVGFREREKLAIETGLRCIAYVVIFSIVVTGLDMPTNVAIWSFCLPTLLLGCSILKPK